MSGLLRGIGLEVSAVSTEAPAPEGKVPAAAAVANAQILDQARIVAEQLQTRLISRAVVDQAVGILMSRRGITAAEAFASLQPMSRRENMTLNTVALSIGDEAVKRARARHSAT